VVGRQYSRIVLYSSLAAAVCLLFANARYSELAAARGWSFGSSGFVLAIVPSTLCILFWIFQKRIWIRYAGVIATLGVLAYSAYVLLRALTTHRLSGDMAFLIELEGVVTVAVTLGWSILALVVSWLGNRTAARAALSSTVRPP
jgi:hypothetical protein